MPLNCPSKFMQLVSKSPIVLNCLELRDDLHLGTDLDSDLGGNMDVDLHGTVDADLRRLGISYLNGERWVIFDSRLAILSCD